MEEKIIFICEDSLDGIFTAVYQGWTAGCASLEIRTQEPDNLELFCTCREVLTDAGQAEKVARSIRRKLGVSVYQDLCYALASTHPEKATAVFRVLRQALGGGRCNRRIMDALADPSVSLVSKLRVKVWHEFHRHLGFVRFRELSGRLLLAQITPDNDILELLGPHFANRLPNENWMIYDEKRCKALLHPRQGVCVLRRDVVFAKEKLAELALQEEYEALWRTFLRSVTIEERKNPKLQQQFLPLKYRENMPEFL